MLNARINWCKERKGQIHRLPIHRVEVDRFFQQSQNAHHLIQSIQAGMRECNAVADTRRTQALTLQEGLDSCGMGHAIGGFGNIAEFMYQTLLAGCP